MIIICAHIHKKKLFLYYVGDVLLYCYMYLFFRNALPTTKCFVLIGLIVFTHRLDNNTTKSLDRVAERTKTYQNLLNWGRNQYTTATRFYICVLNCPSFAGTCSSSPCMHGGTCVIVSKTRYMCNCSNSAFNGTHCEGSLYNPGFAFHWWVVMIG